MKLQIFFALFFCLLLTSYAQTTTEVNAETGEATVTTEAGEAEVSTTVTEGGEVTTTVESGGEEVTVVVESPTETGEIPIPGSGQTNTPQTSQAPGTLPGVTSGVTETQTVTTGGLSGSIVTPLVGIASLVAAFIIA